MQRSKSSAAVHPNFADVVCQLKCLPVKHVAAILQALSRQIPQEKKVLSFSKTIMSEVLGDGNLLYNFNLARLSKNISREFDDNGAAFTSELIEMTSRKIAAPSNGFLVKLEIVNFAGNLYKVDLISSFQVYEWVIALATSVSDQNNLLYIIRDRVEDEFQKPFHDTAVNSLRSMLVLSRFVNLKEVVVQPEPPTP